MERTMVVVLNFSRYTHTTTRSIDTTSKPAFVPNKLVGTHSSFFALYDRYQLEL